MLCVILFVCPFLYLSDLTSQHVSTGTDLIDPARSQPYIYNAKTESLQQRLQDMQLFISIRINTLSSIPIWQQVGDQLAFTIQARGFSIARPLTATRNYESEGWMFLKPGNLINGGRILKPLTIPGRMIDIIALQSMTKHVHNALGVDPVLHIGMQHVFVFCPYFSNRQTFGF
jgi:hypothetical protein